MEFQELNDVELQTFHGGADSAASMGAGLTMTTGSLISVGYHYDNGNGRSYRSQLDIGKDVKFDFGALGSKLQP